jgi:hypothetical protein
MANGAMVKLCQTQQADFKPVFKKQRRLQITAYSFEKFL